MSGLSVQPDRRPGSLDHAIQSVTDRTVLPMARVVGKAAERGRVWLVFAVLWLAFGVALVANPGSLDATWVWIGSLPLVVQVMAWLLFLPVTAGLWVWESGWPMIARLLIVVSLAGWSLLLFLPRRPGAEHA